MMCQQRVYELKRPIVNEKPCHERKIMLVRANHMMYLFIRKKYCRLNVNTVDGQKMLARKHFGVRVVNMHV